MTKTVKKILLFVTCLVMFFCTAMFAACGGDKNCAHEYGEWKIETQATCTEKGLKTRVCSKCNDVESEVIPAGHKGTLYCSACNKTLVDDKFSTAFNNSFGTIKKNSGIEVSISDFTFYNKNLQNVHNIKNVKAFIGLDDAGELFGYGNLDWVGEEFGYGSISAQFVLQDYKIYYYESMNSTNDSAEEYGITVIAEELADVIDSEELEAEDISKILSIVISEMPTFVDEDLSALTAKLTESVKTGMLITKMASLDSLVDLTEGSVDYVLTKKAKVFSDLVDDFVNLKAMDFIKKYFGNEVSKMISDTPNLLNKKVSVLQSELAENGITVNGIVALLDEYAKLYSNNQEDTFKSLTNIDIAKTVNDYKDKTIVDIIYDLVKDQSSSINKQMIENQVLGAITTLTTKTLPQLLCEDDDALEYFNKSVVEIKKMATVLDETFSYNYVFAKDGKSCGKATAEFKPYKFSKEFSEALDNIIFDENLTITGEISFGSTPNANAVLDVDALIKKVSDKVKADEEAKAESERIKTELLSYVNFDNVAVKCEKTYNNSSSAYTYIKNADGTIMYVKKNSNEVYYEKVDDNSYNVYTKSGESWVKDTYNDKPDDLDFFDDIAYSIRNYHKTNIRYGWVYTYDSTSGKYCYNNYINYYVENNKLVKIEHSYDGVYAFTYDDINLTLPIISSQKITSESEWNSAMSFDGVVAKCIYNETGDNITATIIKNGSGNIYYICIEEDDNIDEYYFAQVNEEYYSYTKNSSGEWNKTKIDKDAYESGVEEFSVFSICEYKYSDFTYNSETGAYEASEDIWNISIWFANGMIDKIIANSDRINDIATVQYFYRYITIALPTVEDNDDTPITNPTKPTNPTNPTNPTESSNPTESTQIHQLILSATTFDGVAVDCAYTYNGKTTHYIKNADGTIIYYSESENNTTRGTYFEVSGDYCYVYESVNGTWYKSAAYEFKDYDDIVGFFDYTTKYYSNSNAFSYNEQSKMYTNGDVSVLIKDEKLIKEVFYDVIYEYSYDNINLILPTVGDTLVSQQFSSELEWNAAISFDGIAAICIEPHVKYSMIFGKNAESTILYTYEIYWVEYYYSIENGMYYEYYKNGNEVWCKEESDEEEFAYQFEFFNIPFEFSDFTYNSETGVYEGVYYNTKYSVTFVNDRVVKIVETYEGEIMRTIEYSYDNINLTLPMVGESGEDENEGGQSTDNTEPSYPNDSDTPAEPSETVVSQQFTTEAEWNAALTFDNIDAMVDVSLMGEIFQVKKNTNGDLNLIYYDDGNEYYYSVLNEKHYRIYEISSNKWIKIEISKDYITISDGLFNLLSEFNYSDFTYNSEKGFYENNSGNICIIFANNKISKILVTFNFDGETITNVYKYSYDDLSFSFPIAEEWTSSQLIETEWNSAMFFDNTAAEVVVKAWGEIVVVKKNSGNNIMYYNDNNVDEYYYSFENEKYYVYTKTQNGKWAKEETVINKTPFSNGPFNNLLSVFNYSNFTYNSEKGIYEYVVNDGIYYVSFSNGRIDKILEVFEEYGKIEIASFEYFYDNIEVILPTENIIDCDEIKNSIISAATFDNVAVKCMQTYNGQYSSCYTKNAEGTIIYYFDSYDNEELYFEIDGNYYYVYSKNSDGAWCKSSVYELKNDYTYYSNCVCFFDYVAENYSRLSGFMYDEASKMYTNGNVCALIEDGKLIKEVYDYVIYEYSYDNINLTLPTVEENSISNVA